MENRYKNFSAVDFAKDDYFLQWRLAGDEGPRRFWESYMSAHPDQRTEIEKAAAIVESAVISDPMFTPQEKEAAVERLAQRYMLRDKRSRRTRYYVASAVACAILLLVAGSIWLSTDPGGQHSSGEIAGVPAEQIRLISGEKVVILTDQTEITYNTRGEIEFGSNVEDMVNPGVEADSSVVMNKLIVPRGRRLSALLSDGSRVWVNSGSSIEFPAVFAPGRREIRAEGEIYIEVAKKEDAPFFVATENLVIGVLGTTFNVSAYKDDPFESVVLVEGSVSVTTRAGESRQLSPNQMMTLADGKMTVEKVGVDNYISWIDGVLSFDGEPLDTILQKLSRYYAVDIVYGEGIGELRCSGKLVLTEDVREVLKNISVISPVTCNINNNKIEISMRENP